MQRIAKKDTFRQQKHHQRYMSDNVPRKRLHHSQSVHGYNDVDKAEPEYVYLDKTQTPPIDPNNYIIWPPRLVVTSARSPSRTSDSDTVETTC